MRSLSSTVADDALDLQAVAQGRVEDLDGPAVLLPCLRSDVSGARDRPENGRSRPEGGFSVHVAGHVHYE